MADQPLTPSQKRFRGRARIVSFVSAALLIAIVFAMRPLLPGGPLHTDDHLALIAGAILLQMGIIMVLMHSVFPKDAAMPDQRFAQVLNFLSASAVLLLPLFGGRFLAPWLSFAIAMALIAIMYWTAWLIWRAADELMRQLLQDSYVAGYFVIVLALTVYAVGERLGLLGGVTAWGALGFASLVNIFCSMRAVYRRGLDKPLSD